jgi:hypothetical protein
MILHTINEGPVPAQELDDLRREVSELGSLKRGAEEKDGLDQALAIFREDFLIRLVYFLLGIVLVKRVN